MTEPGRKPTYELGPDVDLAAEDVRRADGSRLTARDADDLAREALAVLRRGRPPVDPAVAAGERSPRLTFRVPAQTRRRLEERAREQGRPVAEVVREAVELYLR